MKDHICCYINSPEPGTIHIGVNGGDSPWIRFCHYDRWNATAPASSADGGGYEMQGLGELLCDKYWD
jgi:hypothetical protein